MALVQYIYTSILGVEMTPRRAYEESLLSAGLCRKFGITGRVFANSQRALAITEGPEETVTRYFNAVSQDEMAASVLLHVRRIITVQEFSDFIILLNADHSFDADPFVQPLTAESFKNVWPPKLSAKVRILSDAYMDPEMLAA